MSCAVARARSLGVPPSAEVAAAWQGGAAPWHVLLPAPPAATGGEWPALHGWLVRRANVSAAQAGLLNMPCQLQQPRCAGICQCVNWHQRRCGGRCAALPMIPSAPAALTLFYRSAPLHAALPLLPEALGRSGWPPSPARHPWWTTTQGKVSPPVTACTAAARLGRVLGEMVSPGQHSSCQRHAWSFAFGNA